MKVLTKLMGVIPTELAVFSLSNIITNGITNAFQIIGESSGAEQHLISIRTRNGDSADNRLLFNF